jgi:hypothetical protein
MLNTSHPQLRSAAVRVLIATTLTVTAGAAAAQGVDREETQVKFQATWISQRHGAFGERRPAGLDPTKYSGDNPVYSLGAPSDRTYTFSFTGYFGLRPWEGGELYLNPEITQGVPFTGDLIGLGGFYNGEITRAAGTHPKIYRQRLFMRQTWNRGGGQEAVDADLNWMAGQVDKSRTVLTVGNFSTLDVFDRNKYAGDPRRQFMNWGGMTHAAFDYAADARGFGWGAAAEWYLGDWALRAGRMTGPVTPNAQAMDLKILKHFGDQIEIEHDHEFGGQPGALRLLVWRNKALLARFADATARGNQLNWQPGLNGMEYILDVRNGDRIKWGAGVDFEQTLAGEWGIFGRAMWADGQTETYAFAEADRSLAFGIAGDGAAWQRPKDRMGLALMTNHLAPGRRSYLASGGISFFIGDGWLRYRPEAAIEAYYSFALAVDAALTLDLQKVHNPAYNADRGPVTIFGIRLHAEF